MRKLVALLAGAALMVATGSAFAAPIPSLGGEYPDLKTVLDSITVGGASSVNVQTDYIADGNDANWHITASGGSFATMIIQVAGLASSSTFGVYDISDPTNRVALFSGQQESGNQAALSILADGTVRLNVVNKVGKFSGTTFGYYLTAGNDTFFSDTSLNADKLDHMLAYQGKDYVQIGDLAPGLWTTNEYILAFEDLLGGGDFDYQDFVVMVESVVPTPEPGTVLLLGAGLLGLGFYGRRRMKKA